MSFSDLPREILRDILERLQVKNVIICSSVCKSWHSLIINNDFIVSHLKQSKLRSKGYLLHIPSSKSDQQMSRVICDSTMAECFNLTFPFDCKSINMTPVGSCNGLLCLTSDDSYYFGRNVYLWNPSIRKLKSVSISLDVKPHFLKMPTSVVLGLGFDHVSGDHKIVRLSYLWDGIEWSYQTMANETEVYSLQANSWRRIGAPVLCRAHNSSKAFVNGAIHWIAEGPKGDLILAFDFSNEMFQELMLPTFYDAIGIHYYYYKILVEFHGSLSLLINDSPDDNGMFYCCCMWVMKNYGAAESWVMLFRFVAEEGIYTFPGRTTSGELIYQNREMEYILYDLVNERHKKTGIHGYCSHLVPFIESLVLLEEH